MTPSPVLFCYEAFDEEAARLRHYADLAGLPIGTTPLTIQETGHAAPPAPLISLRTQSRIPLAWAPALRGILSRSTGYDHLAAYRDALQALPSAPPVPALGYLPEYCVRAVAEQALLLWSALLRNLPAQIRHFPAFDRNGLTGRESLAKTIAVFGVGRIGSEIATIAAALGMDVLAVDPVVKRPDLPYLPPAEAARRADILVCAMSLNPTSRGYFSLDFFRQTVRKPLFVNISRGECSPAAGLEAALEAGLLSGAALDVFNEESTLAPALRTPDPSLLTPDNQALLRLARRPDVILTPHNAFNTAEAVERKSALSIQSALHFLQTAAFPSPVP